MTDLSNPQGMLGTQTYVDEDGVTKKDIPHRNAMAVTKLVLEGPDAHWLMRIAEERHMTIEALVKIYVIEGLLRARNYREL